VRRTRDRAQGRAEGAVRKAYRDDVKSVSCPSWVGTAPLRSLEYSILWQRGARGRRLVRSTRRAAGIPSPTEGAGSEELGLQG
jgi:hypothetical protein